MILEYNGQSTDWWEFLFTKTKFQKLGFWISGGLDSAFSLWYTAYCTTNKFWLLDQPWPETINREFSLLPIHGKDTTRKYTDSLPTATNVVKWIQNNLPNAPVQDLHVFDNLVECEEKGEYFKQEKHKLKKFGEIEIVVPSYSMNPPKEVMLQNTEMYNKRDPKRDYDHYPDWHDHRPLSGVDKKCIAYFYKHFKLEELIPLTFSCTGDNKSAEDMPCKECFWCHEKKWAFECY